MFEPYQTALALQAKPAFVNAFIRQRAKQSETLAEFLAKGSAVGAQLREFLLVNDYLPSGDTEHDIADCFQIAKDVITYRHWNDPFGADGLDSVRHTLRLLRQSNLPDTRLIVCSMAGDYNYPDIDNLMSDPEYADVIERIVITADPSYLARFTSTNQVIDYQRRFMTAVANDAKKS
jgi:hypothetical protein